MARKTLNYTVTDKGRDFGKVFVLTEMLASKAERWATRAIFAIMNNNIELPALPADFEKNASMAILMEMGIKALGSLKFEDAEPLLKEMLDCVQTMPDPSKPHILRALFEEDTEEVMTRIKLRKAVWSLHSDFFEAVAPSILQEQATDRRSSGRNTKTSQ